MRDVTYSQVITGLCFFQLVVLHGLLLRISSMLLYHRQTSKKKQTHRRTSTVVLTCHVRLQLVRASQLGKWSLGMSIPVKFGLQKL